MPQVPNINDINRANRVALSKVASMQSWAVNNIVQSNVNDPEAALPPYQKDGWNLSYSVMVSAAAFALYTNTLNTFDPGGPGDISVIYAGATLTTLQYGARSGFSGWTGNRWHFQAQGSVFYSLSTAGDAEFKMTPTRNGVTSNPPVSAGVWVCSVTFDCNLYPLSSIYIQPVY